MDEPTSPGAPTAPPEAPGYAPPAGWQQPPYPQAPPNQPYPGPAYPGQPYPQGPGFPAPQAAGPAYAGVWPPPPGGVSQEPVWFPLRFVYRRVEGALSDFRDGMVGVNPFGIVIDGRTQPRAEIYQTVALVSFLIIGIPGLLISTTIMRYAMLTRNVLQLPWNTIQSVVWKADKRIVCLVYDAPNYAGVIKRYSLAFRLPPELFPAFQEQIQGLAPGKGGEGKIKNPDAIAMWILAVLVLLITAAVVWALNAK